MEWMESLSRTIDYIETNLTEALTTEDIASQVGISPFYLQRSFQMLTGYSLKEYIRNRRLYLAAKELKETDNKIIDIAYKHGYETPEAFTKAFSRFHQTTPSKVREGENYQPFYKISIRVSIVQEEDMEGKIVPMGKLQLIGFERKFSYENSYEEIPKFWDEYTQTYCQRIYQGLDAETEEEKAILENNVGEYAICLDTDPDSGCFRYLIAGRYVGGKVPETMKVLELEKGDWAVFDCFGPNPETLQQTNTRVFNEWIPDNMEYQTRAPYNIEWYDTMADMDNQQYHSAIWIPVEKK